MSWWLIALAVWIAAGARVGRVLVRPATQVRMAIVVAVAMIAAATTVRIPEVADSIDHLVGGPPEARDLAARLTIAAWIGFASAASVLAAAAWQRTAQTSLRGYASAIYLLGAVLMIVTIWIWPPIGWAAVVIGAAFVTVTGVLNLDWTPLGRGIAIFVVGTALVTVTAALELPHASSDSSGAVARAEPGWAWALAALIISLGSVWILIEVWFRARLVLRRVRPLHTTLIDRFPEVLDADTRHSTASLRASDHVAQVMDAMYLQAGGGVVADDSDKTPPADVDTRARAVAWWVRKPHGRAPLGTSWLAPPEGVTTRRWVSAVAKAFRAH